MDARYEITPYIAQNMVRIKMGGFFGQQDVQGFAATYRDALSNLQAPGHLTLVDITAMKIQAQDIVGGFAALLASPDIRSRKLAFVCSSSLARLQAQRLTDREGVEFFDRVDDAEAWLLALWWLGNEKEPVRPLWNAPLIAARGWVSLRSCRGRQALEGIVIPSFQGFGMLVEMPPWIC